MSRPIISFLTDFSTRDGYVGAVCGVIISLFPDVRISDISHEIPPQDVAHAAFVLHTAARYFPKGTIHLAVVDPAVGTSRRAICLKTENYLFVGPDNGIFSPFLEEANSIYSLENDHYWRKEVSETFHGRDIFGPVAAHLAMGLDPSLLGPKIENPSHLQTWINSRTAQRIEGAIVHIDHFGNCITSVSPEEVSNFGEYTIRVEDHLALSEQSLCKTYADASLGESCWLPGSAGLIELAVNGGSAAEMYGIERGDKVFFEQNE